MLTPMRNSVPAVLLHYLSMAFLTQPYHADIQHTSLPQLQNQMIQRILFIQHLPIANTSATMTLFTHHHTGASPYTKRERIRAYKTYSTRTTKKIMNPKNKKKEKKVENA
jgi:hypothetical protein